MTLWESLLLSCEVHEFWNRVPHFFVGTLALADSRRSNKRIVVAMRCHVATPSGICAAKL